MAPAMTTTSATMRPTNTAAAWPPSSFSIERRVTRARTAAISRAPARTPAAVIQSWAVRPLDTAGDLPGRRYREVPVRLRRGRAHAGRGPEPHGGEVLEHVGHVQ